MNIFMRLFCKHISIEENSEKYAYTKDQLGFKVGDTEYRSILGLICEFADAENTKYVNIMGVDNLQSGDGLFYVSTNAIKRCSMKTNELSKMM